MTKKWKKPKMKHGKFTKYMWLPWNPEGIHLGHNLDIGALTYIDGKEGVYIEDNVQIGGGCHIYSHNTIEDYQGSVILKKGCNIGSHSLILPGVIIEENEIIKAKSIVYINKKGERIIK